MKPLSLVGILLIVAGVAALVVGRVSYTTKEKVLDIGPIEATAEKTETIRIPDVAGIIAALAGVVLVVAGTRRRS